MTPGWLGVDPGSTTGGAALLDGETVTRWLAWTYLKGGGGRFRVRMHDGTLELPHLHDVACLLARWAPYHLVLEGLFVAHGRGAKGKAKRRSLLPLAESAGELLGPLRASSAGPVQRPLAQRQWRPDVLGLPPTTNDKDAEERAVQWARRHLTWQAELGRWDLTLAEEGAVCEAACMALWGQQR